jgi:hypothetical protein
MGNDGGVEWMAGIGVFGEWMTTVIPQGLGLICRLLRNNLSQLDKRPHCVRSDIAPLGRPNTLITHHMLQLYGIVNTLSAPFGLAHWGKYQVLHFDWPPKEVWSTKQSSSVITKQCCVSPIWKKANYNWSWQIIWCVCGAAGHITTAQFSECVSKLNVAEQ